MRKLIGFISLIVIISLGYFYMDNFTELTKEDISDKINAPQLKSNQTKKTKEALLHGDLFKLIGESDEQLEKDLGSPLRIDKTPYGYVWWVYLDEDENYVLYGVDNNKIETVFATGQSISSSPFQIGDSYQTIADKFPFETEVSYKDGLSYYTFKLKDTDLKTNPLIKLSDDLFAVTYFDTFTEQLSSLRIMTGDMLIKQRFYEMEYRGPLPEEKELTDDDWIGIEQAMEEQIFELTNLYRKRFNVARLEKDESTSKVAYLHSKDMYDNNYFSHDSQDGRGLKERLEAQHVHYLSAGENIAAQHTDALAAMEGWLNSEGHREALLYEDYNYIGIGVHRLYYTQNFLLKP